MRRRPTSRTTRQSASASTSSTVVENVRTIKVEDEDDEVFQLPRYQGSRMKRTAQSWSKRAEPATDSDPDSNEYIDPDPDPDPIEDEPRVKRRKITTRLSEKNAIRDLYTRIFKTPHKGLQNNDISTIPSIELVARAHNVTYHHPLLLHNREARASLLDWFDGVSTTRNMPWRKAWINPNEGSKDLRQLLERRAYEVWISEIMLQQTRVATVIDYWNRWMARWPTIQDLAKAEPDEVLAAWRGLGYYSRATRIHKAAKAVCKDKQMKGLLPSGVEELVQKVPGVGRYTAGAISAIVFGRPAPMVDGNVLRVLSRVMGVLGDVKADKGVIDLLWEAADRLVKTVARDRLGDDDIDMVDEDTKEESSDRPGRWGQALMELGSTVCTPKPNCAECPIASSCRAYGEGLQLAAKQGLAPESTSENTPVDIEDACTFCKPFKQYANSDSNNQDATMAISSRQQQKPKTKMQATLQSFAFTQTTSTSSMSMNNPKKTSKQRTTTISPAAVEVIANHAKKFPVKKAKKDVREEETLVCAIRRNDGRYLVHRRPEKGLLAGLWELPSYVLKEPQTSTAKTRKEDADRFARDLVGRNRSERVKVKHIGDLGSVPWLFSHLRLTMHVHLFEFDSDDGELENDGSEGVQSRWSEDRVIDEESMGTGMRKCWALVKEASGG
ncbi:DNA glycosylase [Rostrohypoxylon terebratum]|nr:DNA glycosylase [Rostrohypoxylon terebratum]